MAGLGRAGRLTTPVAVFASDTLEKFPKVIGEGGFIKQ